MKMSSEKEYVKNTVILLIGKFCTQFISLLLVPLYTHYLIAKDYGTIDLLQTYITLFVPILTLKLDSAIFRFLVDRRNVDKDKENIISNVSFLTLISILTTIIIFIVLTLFIDIQYLELTLINIIILMFSNVFLQLLRGLGKNLEYSIASIITGTMTLLINVFLIVFMKYGAESILIASSVSNLICILYIIWSTKFYRFVKLKKINVCIIKELLKYSIPMIPNSLSWWIVNVSDRTIISIFLGTAFNGIYTISCKFSNILNSIFSIFNMSWQETATLHINDKNRDSFFSNMINNILMLFSSLALFILVLLPVVYDILIGDEYITSYNYIPILLYANSWNVLIGLIGGIYVAFKKTREIANTTIISAIINLIIHIVLVNYIGLYAACISTLISQIIMGIYRYRDCQRYINIKLNIKRFAIFTIIFIISQYVYLLNNKYFNIVNIIIVSIYLIYENRQYICIMKKYINKTIKYKKN